MYRLLASLFARELSAQALVGFQSGKASELLHALATVQDYAPLISRLQKQFSGMGSDPDQASLDLAASYAWCFHGVGGPHAAPLYASVYLSDSGSTHQAVEGELRQAIHQQGLRSENPNKEPYDHLSVILEFVARLDEQDEADRLQQTRRQIIEKYLLTWLPAFISRCQHADPSGFYAELAQMTREFVAADFAQSGGTRSDGTDVGPTGISN